MPTAKARRWGTHTAFASPMEPGPAGAQETGFLAAPPGMNEFGLAIDRLALFSVGYGTQLPNRMAL